MYVPSPDRKKTFLYFVRLFLPNSQISGQVSYSKYSVVNFQEKIGTKTVKIIADGCSYV
jgi:hypothetical protein